jgi:hypothetical protein
MNIIKSEASSRASPSSVKRSSLPKPKVVKITFDNLADLSGKAIEVEVEVDQVEAVLKLKKAGEAAAISFNTLFKESHE